METADLQTRTFVIEGMTCASCQNRIEGKLKSMAGVEAVSVSYETGRASVKRMTQASSVGCGLNRGTL